MNNSAVMAQLYRSGFSLREVAANFGTAHSLMDLFGLAHLAGDQLRVTVQASAGGPYAVLGQFSHALAT